MKRSEDIEDYLDDLDGSRADLIHRALEIAEESLPELELKVAGGWGTINLGAPKFLGCVAATKTGAKLYFRWGEFLEGPSGYIDRIGKHMAQKDINSKKDIDRKAVADLFRQASELSNDT